MQGCSDHIFARTHLKNLKICFFSLFISFFDLFIYLFIDYLAPLHMQEFSLVLLLF